MYVRVPFRFVHLYILYTCEMYSEVKKRTRLCEVRKRRRKKNTCWLCRVSCMLLLCCTIHVQYMYLWNCICNMIKWGKKNGLWEIRKARNKENADSALFPLCCAVGSVCSVDWRRGVERREVFPAGSPMAHPCQALPCGYLRLQQAPVTLRAANSFLPTTPPNIVWLGLERGGREGWGNTIYLPASIYCILTQEGREIGRVETNRWLEWKRRWEEWWREVKPTHHCSNLGSHGHLWFYCRNSVVKKNKREKKNSTTFHHRYYCCWSTCCFWCFFYTLWTNEKWYFVCMNHAASKKNKVFFWVLTNGHLNMLAAVFALCVFIVFFCLLLMKFVTYYYYFHEILFVTLSCMQWIVECSEEEEAVKKVCATKGVFGVCVGSVDVCEC